MLRAARRPLRCTLCAAWSEPSAAAAHGPYAPTLTPIHTSIHTRGRTQELTYDYRFHGDTQLPCNCGAASCRGHVNISEEVEEEALGTLRLPRAQVASLRAAMAASGDAAWGAGGGGNQ